MSDLQTRLNRIERLFATTRRLATESDPVRLRETALEAVIAFVDADQGFVLLREAGGRPRVRAAVNLDRETMRSERFKPLRQIAEQVLRRGEPFLSASLDADSRVNPADSLMDAARSVLALPMRVSQNVIGVIYTERYHDGSGPIGVNDLRVVQSFADLTAEMLTARTRLAELEARLTEEAHVRRSVEQMAAELHDEVAAKSVELAQVERELDSKNRALAKRYALGQAVGQSPAMRAIFETVERVADYPVPVLLVGEPGAGKSLIARTIHQHGLRREAPFLTLDCSALPAQLIANELFGYVEGAFPGAARARPGLLVEARKGTLHLKEIFALPHALQARLAQALRDGVVRPNGGSDATPVEARLIASTRMTPLEAQATEAALPALFDQLSVIEIEIPPLRARTEDIRPLAEHFLARLVSELRLPARVFSEAALRRFMRFQWPGNVRQLENTVKSSVLLASDDVIEPESLRLPTASLEYDAADASISLEMMVPATGVQTRAEWEAKEKQAILDALVRCNWNKTRAAEALGVSRRNLYRKLARYGIEGS